MGSSVLFRTGAAKGWRIASWNVGSLCRKTAEVVEELERRKVDVCCLQEVRWRGGSARGIMGRTSKYKLFWSGNKEGTGGVGIMLEDGWSEKVIDVQRVSDRIIFVKVVVGKVIAVFISAYAPQVGRSEEEKDEFWSSLTECVMKISESELVFIGGDLNGHVGEKSEGFVEVHGGFGFGERNKEGDSVLQFATAMDLIVCNTWFKKEKNKLVTYKSGGCESMIDYILVRRGQRKSVTNVNAIATVEKEGVVTQHRLLVAELTIKTEKKRKIKVCSRLKVWRLKEPKEKESYQLAVREKMVGCQADWGVEEFWKYGAKVLIDAAEQVCGRKKGPRRHKETWWWNSEVEEALKTKKQSYQRWREHRREEDLAIYREHRRMANKAIALAKTTQQINFAEKLQTKEGRNNLSRMVKQMNRNRKDVIGAGCLKDEKGSIQTKEEDIVNIWKKYMEKLTNEENPFDREGLNETEVKQGCCVRISLKDVEVALRGMKDGKAAGRTEVVAELLKAAGEIGIQWLADLFNKILKEGCIPDDWTRSVLIPLYKGKGDPMECGSYRAIKLLEHAMKVFESVLDKIIRQRVDLAKLQFGFIPGKGTTDAIFVVRQMQERYREKNKELYFAFIDLEKAFDRVPRDIMRWALRKAGVEEWLVQAVMSLYRNPRTCIKIQEVFSGEFEVGVGVHQGSVLSPLIFIIVMDVLARELGGNLPWELLYADDLMLMEFSEEGIREKLRRWKHGLEIRGLKVNMEKTKVMAMGKASNLDHKSGKWPCGVCRKGVGSNSIQCSRCLQWIHKKCSGIKGRLKTNQDFVCRNCLNRQTSEGVGTVPKREIELEKQSIEKVTSFCYLGDVIGMDGSADLAVEARIRSGWNKYREMSPILQGKFVSWKLKGRVYDSCVRKCMTYACETWPLTQANLNRLLSTERRMIRYMCGFSWKDKKRNEDLLREVGLEPVDVTIRKSRLRWYGHVLRKEDDDWVRKCMDVVVEGCMPKGRPKKRWKDNVKVDLKRLGLVEDDAMDRSLWRRKVWGPG